MAFDPEAMDRAAIEAGEELDQIPRETILPIAEWWSKWYLKAGHKRLGRILVSIAKEANNKGERR